MKNFTTSQVHMSQKIAFGLGMLANQMFPAALGIFIVVLVENLGFPGWMLGLIYFVPKLFDAITDPIMGFISDNTKSKWGRRRQYVLGGAIIMGFSFAFMWQLYPSSGVSYNFIYFLVWSLIFYLGLTIFSVPYVAMGYEMSDDFHERTQIMAIAQLIGQLAWVIAPWFWVIMGDRNLFDSGEEATRTLAIYVAIGCALLAAIPALFMKSKSTLHENYSPLSIRNLSGSFHEIILGFKEALKIVPFKKLCLATFLIFNAFNTIAGFSYFIIKYYLFNGNEQEMWFWPTLFGSVGAIITTVLVIPIVSRMSRKIGKKNAFLFSQSISIVGYILLWFLFIPGKAYLFLFALPFFSFGIGSLFTLMMSMTSDVIDIDELNTGKRREGIFGAIYWWMVKFGLAIAGLLSGIILSLVHFESGASTQSPESLLGLRIFFSGLPILGTLTAIWIMSDYDVSEEKAKEIRLQLDIKKGKIIPSNSSSGFGTSMIEYELNSKYHTELDFLSNQPKLAEITVKNQFQSTLQSNNFGICFSAFTENQKPGDEISEEQITRRLHTLKPHFEWIRVFSTTHGHELIPKIAKQMGFKVLAGAWIGKDEIDNKKEIDSLIQLIQNGYVDLAAVGNEVRFRGDQDEHKILEYIKYVKKENSKIPICYVDVYSEFIKYPSLIQESDKILINCYPFWEGASIEHAPLFLQEMIHKTKAHVGDKEVIITETGWPSSGELIGNAIPNPINAMKYFYESQKLCQENKIKLFYFSSFDESWKKDTEGKVGISWGIWDSNGQLKY
jgi:GPH family glycoside/pentoside/hexuronide:cation symporter